VTHLDYASSPEFRSAVTRAQWAVIQTGLITSGLALFGVYVLATRINDLHLMSVYLLNWVPAGPMVVGLISGSGYILASWWFGVRIGRRTFLGILALQTAMFIACHYADFETLDLVYRDTGQSVNFVTFFDYSTRRLARDYGDFSADPPRTRGYAIRAAEALSFAAGGLLSALTLVGRPRCGLCGGLVRRRNLGKIGGPPLSETIKRLEDRARAGDAPGFTDAIAAHHDVVSSDDPSATELTIARCEVCGVATIEPARNADADAPTPPALPSSLDPEWHIDVHGEFARQLFDQKPRPHPQPHPHGDSIA
jgi:hypothetical protein